MLNYLNTHFESIISLQELADQVHLSREVCCRMDIILGFCVRNHSGIDLHDTDIDFSDLLFPKRTAPLTYYASMRLFFLLFVFNRSQGLTWFGYIPSVSFTRITWILSLCLEYLVIRNWQQMVSGDLQSKHFPVSLHGVWYQISAH